MDGIRSLAFKVLQECSMRISDVPLPERPDVEHHLQQTLEQDTFPARVRGQDAVTETAQAETCWHCHGEKVCRCAFCAVQAPQMRWVKGECAACKGTGFLCWPEVSQ